MVYPVFYLYIFKFHLIIYSCLYRDLDIFYEYSVFCYVVIKNYVIKIFHFCLFLLYKTTTKTFNVNHLCFMTLLNLLNFNSLCVDCFWIFYQHNHAICK